MKLLFNIRDFTHGDVCIIASSIAEAQHFARYMRDSYPDEENTISAWEKSWKNGEGTSKGYLVVGKNGEHILVNVDFVRDKMPHLLILTVADLTLSINIKTRFEDWVKGPKNDSGDFLDPVVSVYGDECTELLAVYERLYPDRLSMLSTLRGILGDVTGRVYIDIYRLRIMELNELLVRGADIDVRSFDELDLTVSIAALLESNIQRFLLIDQLGTVDLPNGAIFINDRGQYFRLDTVDKTAFFPVSITGFLPL